MRVLTPSGYARIDSLSRHSAVVTYDARSGALQESRVKKLVRHSASRTLEIAFFGSDRTLKVTADHSLRTADHRWVTAKRLEVGMRLASVHGALEISGIKNGEAQEPVYNLYPYGDKTFVVEGVVAHSFTRFRAAREFLHAAAEAGRAASPLAPRALTD